VTVTQADRWGWQYQAARELCTILLAQRDLPAVPWIVSDSGSSLAGRISGLDPPGQVRYLSGAWRAALDLAEDAELHGGRIAYMSAATYRREARVRLAAAVTRDGQGDHDGCADAAVTW
jgi:hypothetical protein